jgi:phage repressor protein C with HTH and peptisase S24 domain
MSLANRITEIRHDTGKNKSQFGKELGVSHAAVQQWENGETKSISYDVLTRLEKKYGYNPEWVNSGKLPKKSSRYLKVAENTPAYRTGVNIPKISLESGKETPTDFNLVHTDEENPSLPYFRRDWIKKNGWNEDKLSYMEVSGNSMEVALFAGDKVLINEESAKPINGSAFAVAVDGELEIKRLQRRGGTWWLTSDNPAHTRYDQPLEDLKQIVGLVACRISLVI